MQDWPLNRRQFLTVSAGALALTTGARAWAGEVGAWHASMPKLGLDPHLALACMHQFTDHDISSWARCTRMSGQLAHAQLDKLKSILGEQGVIQSHWIDGEDAWVTLLLQEPALQRMLQGGVYVFKDHIWGAPWAHLSRPATSTDRPVAMSEFMAKRRGITTEALDHAGAHRILIIDHGFPVQRLQDLHIAHSHHRSLLTDPMPCATHRAHSHGAQVTGLLLNGLDGRGPWPNAPLALYELPDDILQTMPYAALWPDVLDAVHWAVSGSPRGGRWMVLISLVSTDADRHPQSFISRSARALSAYARSQGVELTWVMAAGNSHADRQNLAWRVRAKQPLQMQWHLPAQNFRPAFLECWHDAAMGQAHVQVHAPGAQWSDVCRPWSMASRVHAPSGRLQTVWRLPPTAAWKASEACAPSGTWGLRMTFERDGVLNAHLAMMTSANHGLLRQSQIGVPAGSLEGVHDQVSLSGLIPFAPDVWVAQTLAPGVSLPWVLNPSSEQLSSYAGRWPSGGDSGGTQAIAFPIDGSAVQSGVMTWSHQGHRMHRMRGTSMAVSLTARWLMGLP